jgi:hypothetical protein
MCFIKNSCIGSAVLITEEPSLPDLMAPLPMSVDYFKSSTSIDCPCYLPPPSPFFYIEAGLLGKLLASVHYNSSLLMKLGQVHKLPCRTSNNQDKSSSRPIRPSSSTPCSRRAWLLKSQRDGSLPSHSSRDCLGRSYTDISSNCAISSPLLSTRREISH